jgi:hypothetical protein
MPSSNNFNCSVVPGTLAHQNYIDGFNRYRYGVADFILQFIEFGYWQHGGQTLISATDGDQGHDIAGANAVNYAGKPVHQTQVGRQFMCQGLRVGSISEDNLTDAIYLFISVTFRSCLAAQTYRAGVASGEFSIFVPAETRIIGFTFCFSLCAEPIHLTAATLDIGVSHSTSLLIMEFACNKMKSLHE